VIGWTISLGEVKKKIKVSILERSRQGSEKACKLGQQFTHILILEFHKPSTSLYRIEVRPLYKEMSGKIKKKNGFENGAYFGVTRST